MKKGLVFSLISLIIGLILGSLITIYSIQIDGVNELDNGVITLKVFNQYFDYYYEYNEINR